MEMVHKLQVILKLSQVTTYFAVSHFERWWYYLDLWQDRIAPQSDRATLFLGCKIKLKKSFKNFCKNTNSVLRWGCALTTILLNLTFFRSTETCPCRTQSRNEVRMQSSTGTLSSPTVSADRTQAMATSLHSTLAMENPTEMLRPGVN